MCISNGRFAPLNSLVPFLDIGESNIRADGAIAKTPMQTFIDSIPLATEKMLGSVGGGIKTTDHEDFVSRLSDDVLTYTRYKSQGAMNFGA